MKRKKKRKIRQLTTIHYEYKRSTNLWILLPIWILRLFAYLLYWLVVCVCACVPFDETSTKDVNTKWVSTTSKNKCRFPYRLLSPARQIQQSCGYLSETVSSTAEKNTSINKFRRFGCEIIGHAKTHTIQWMVIENDFCCWKFNRLFVVVFVGGCLYLCTRIV